MSLDIPELDTNNNPQKNVRLDDGTPQRKTQTVDELFGSEFDDIPATPALEVPAAGRPPASNTREIKQPTGLEGLTADEIADLKRQAAENRCARVAQAFFNSHPEYAAVATPESWSAFELVLEGRGIDPVCQLTPELLEETYALLKRKGVIQVEDNGELQPEPQPRQPVVMRGQVHAAQPQREPMSTGLSDRHAPAVHETDPTDLSALANELSQLPIEQARAKMMALMYQQRQGR